MSASISTPAVLRHSLLAVLFTSLAGCNVFDPVRPDSSAAMDAEIVVGEASAEPTPLTVTSAAPDTTETDTPTANTVDDLWARIRSQLHMQTPDQREIERRISAQMRWFIDHPDYFERVSDRADPFLYMIVEQVEQRGMPMEMALLPIIESGFQPFAYSHGRAAGLWQFIPSTGKHFGLKQNWWYDGRRDVYAATHAALDYLTQLSKQFDGDWLLALASYNAGAGNVRRAIARNKRAGHPTDFWSLKLPRETMNYVPRLLGVSRLVSKPGDYGIPLKPIANQPKLARIDIGGQIDLARAAELAGMSLDELHALNPAFNRWATDPDGPHALLLPTDAAAVLQAGLDNLPHDERIEWHRHVVRNGDTISEIAQHYHTTSRVLKNINGLHNNRIRVGDALLVPTSTLPLDEYKLSADQRLAAKQNKLRNGERVVYTVQHGDNLWSIAHRHGVSTRKLAAWNGMAPRDTLKVGRGLVIWKAKHVADASAHAIRTVSNQDMIRKISYRVRKGDSLYEIARKFRVRITDLKRWNAKTLGKFLQPGQHLTVHVDLTRQGSA